MAVLLLIMLINYSAALDSHEEMALLNVTRFSSGDLFSLGGTDCGLTRCMEVSHGTALAALGGGGSCVCQCRREMPTFREDQQICVNTIVECPMASFGRGDPKPNIPFVFLPLKGQIVYPSKEIIFTDVEDAICAVTSAQYLSSSGWVTLRDVIDNDVPFGLYRDEGSTYLQWRGSTNLHSRLEGRLVAVHVLCSASKSAHLATSCAAFRVAGVSRNGHLDVRSIPFHAGETVTSEPSSHGQGLSVLEVLAIGVCVLMLVFVYAAGIIFYVHYKQKQKRKFKDAELNLSNTNSTDNASTLDSRLDMGSMRMKSNPLLKLDSLRHDYLNDAGLSDVSEQTEDTLDSSPKNGQKFQDRNSNVISAMVHTRRKKPARPTFRATSTPERMSERLQRRSASPEIEKAPHSDLSIFHCSLDDANTDNTETITSSVPNGEPRRKLYFNPVFFEIDYLKEPPPEAVEFLNKLREVMSIAKEKMMSRRFIPMLSDIPEEELYHTIDLGWDIPCARRGRRFSAISLKRENSRRAIYCEGCPGCDSSERAQKTNLTRSNSCKTCVSDDYKQRVVQKWLEEVPQPKVTTTKPIKSIAKVCGTPRVMEPKEKEEEELTDQLESSGEPTRNKDILELTESIVKDYFNGTKTIEKPELVICMEVNSPKNDKTIAPTYTSVVSMHEKKSPNRGTRCVRKKLPPPPPPPINITDLKNNNNTKDIEPVLPEVKKKMEAVIRELNKCTRIEPDKLPIAKNLPADPVGSKLIIPVFGADSCYFSDDNILSNNYRKESAYKESEDFSSLERIMLRKRRYSLDQSPKLNKKEISVYITNPELTRDRLTRSWRDLKNSSGDTYTSTIAMDLTKKKTESLNDSEFLSSSVEPIYNNIETSGSLTIEVRGSPIENKQRECDDFDPDTLDRKPKKACERNESIKCVEKILLKSGGSFKHKNTENGNEENVNPPEDLFTRKIGSLRQIYEARTKPQVADVKFFYERRGSLPYGTLELASYVNNFQKPIENLKPPLPPKQRRSSEHSGRNSSIRGSPPSDRVRTSEERDRFPPYSRNDNLSARRSGRRSSRTRPRRVDIKKLCRTEDSGYLSTDSNESKRKARYMMQMRPKFIPPEPASKPPPLNKTINSHMESDTDDFESLCDGRSESGGESIETDSVFFGNFNDSKLLLDELRIDEFDTRDFLHCRKEIDSGYNRETNIILSGDSDSEHKSVISIVAGHDGRASAASIRNLDEISPYVQSVGC